jgi:hypothetical protein
MRKTLIFIAIIFIIVIFESFNGFWFKSDLERNLIALNALHNVELKLDVAGYYSNQQKIVYRRNKFGLRDDCQDPNDIDIISIGGSTVDQRYIDFKFTFQKVLQEKLKILNENICISNAGVDGHKLADHLKALDKWFPLLKNFKPKYYLIYAGLNDVINTQAGIPKKENYNIINSIRIYIFKNSFLYWFYSQLKNVYGTNNGVYGVFGHKRNKKNNYEFKSLTKTNKFSQDLRDNSVVVGERYKQLIKKIIKRNGIPVCITQSAFFVREGRGVSRAFKYKGDYLNGHDLIFSLNLINDEIRKTCGRQKHIFIDTAKAGFQEGDFYDFAHLNPGGNIKLAKLLFDSLIEELRKVSWP